MDDKFCQTFCGTCPACLRALDDCRRLDAAYASAYVSPSVSDEDQEDEMELLRRAGLNRGRP